MNYYRIHVSNIGSDESLTDAFGRGIVDEMGRGAAAECQLAVSQLRRASAENGGPQRGMPRQLVDYVTSDYHRADGFERSKMAVPWLNWGPAIANEEFTVFDEDAVAELLERGLSICSVCGEDLGQKKIFGRVGGTINGRLGTSGTGMHPRCALLAFHYCPHLKRNGPDKAFAIYEGEGPGLDLPILDEIPGSQPDALWDLREQLSMGNLAEGAREIGLDEVKALARAEPGAGAPAV